MLLKNFEQFAPVLQFPAAASPRLPLISPSLKLKMEVGDGCIYCVRRWFLGFVIKEHGIEQQGIPEPSPNLQNRLSLIKVVFLHCEKEDKPFINNSD
jgi:hypothetical protein